MAKKSKSLSAHSGRIRKSKKRPAWFEAVRFDEPSKWATLQIPEAHAHEVISGLREILASPLWLDLIALQPRLMRQIQHRNWATVPSWELVQMLQRVGDIRVGIDTFLPLPYRSLPLEARRELHLALFIWHALDALQECPTDSFWIPQLASRPWEVRALIPATRPLWYELARPKILETVRHALTRNPLADAGLLAVLCENEESARSIWLPLLQMTPEALTHRLTENVSGAHWEWTGKKGTAHPNMSDLYLSLKQLQRDRSAAEFLARGIAGDLGEEFARVVQHNPDDLVKQESRQKLRGECSVLRHVEHDDGSVEFSLVEQLRSESPSPLDELIETQSPAPVTPSPEEQVQALLTRPGLSLDQRKYLMLLRQNPRQSDNALARGLKKSKTAVRRIRSSLSHE